MTNKRGIVMKNFSKKILSLILVLALTVTAFCFAIPSVSASEDVTGTDIPMVYVVGMGNVLCVTEEDGTKRNVYPIEIPEGYIQQAVEENIDVFAKAVLTQKWDDFCDVLYEKIVPLYSEIALDENGEAPNGSTVKWTWSRKKLKGDKVDGKYPTSRYTFNYDWRMDPFKNAEKLHQYIEDVMYVTGAEKIALTGRCMGAALTDAYMQKYNGEYVSDYIVYNSAANGATQCSKAFCGELYLDSDAVERYMYDIELSEDQTLNQLIRAFITMFNKTYGLDIACWSVNNVYPDIYLNIVPRILRETFATFPSYWTMVNDRDYEKAKETVFYGAPEGKYDNFIKIIDNYHYNVQVKAEELYKGYIEDGIEVSNITKYGQQTIPVTADGDALSDSICTVEDSSYGATTAGVTETFSDQYMKKAEFDGTIKYISPDKKVDASTCMLPDRTWFIKDLAHKTFPKCVERLLDEIINNDSFTVFDNENYPQYLVYSKVDDVASISPMDGDNCHKDDRYDNSFWSAFKKFVEALFQIILANIKTKTA